MRPFFSQGYRLSHNFMDLYPVSGYVVFEESAAHLLYNADA